MTDRISFWEWITSIIGAINGLIIFACIKLSNFITLFVLTPPNIILFVCNLAMLVLIWYRVTWCVSNRLRVKSVWCRCCFMYGMIQTAAAFVIWYTFVNGLLITAAVGLSLSLAQLFLFIFLDKIDKYFDRIWIRKIKERQRKIGIRQ